MISVNALGACLYTPVNRLEAEKLVRHRHWLRSLIIDFEDSVSAADGLLAEETIAERLETLKALLPVTMVFVRVRDAAHLERIRDRAWLRHVNGWVLPKFSHLNATGYLSNIGSGEAFMPILEADIFHGEDLSNTIRLLCPRLNQVLCLRVGANDICSYFGIRRNPALPVYANPVFMKVFTEIFIEARRFALKLAAPVFNSFDSNHFPALAQEIALEKELGIYAKSAIHPAQAEFIEMHYKVDPEEMAEARCVLEDDRAVKSFKMRMVERAVQMRWAGQIAEVAEVHGTRG